MRFHLTLHTGERNAVIPANYQYPLSSAIYKIIRRADAQYANFLHDHGYHAGDSLKEFKLFTFSDLHFPFRNQGDRLIARSNEIAFEACFHIPDAAENFIRGLFLQQKIEIADVHSKAVFSIRQVEGIPVPENPGEILVRTASPLVCGRKNDRGHYDFLPPTDKVFTSLILLNWREKIKAVYETSSEELDHMSIIPVFYSDPPKSRLITIKAGMSGQTKIKGFTNFKMVLKGESSFIKLLLDSGAGLYNAMGMGCLEIIQ